MKIELRHSELIQISFLIDATKANGLLKGDEESDELKVKIDAAIPKALEEILENIDPQMINKYLESIKKTIDINYEIINMIAEYSVIAKSK
jgi:hypothetical protein